MFVCSSILRGCSIDWYFCFGIFTGVLNRYNNGIFKNIRCSVAALKCSSNTVDSVVAFAIIVEDRLDSNLISPHQK